MQSPSIAKDTDPTPLSPKKWTLMIYMDGDQSEMEHDFITAFKNMIKDSVSSNKIVNIIVQFDRIPGGSKCFGNWTICHRFYITAGMEPTEKNAIQDWGDGTGGREVDMSNPETITDFIDWTGKNYPADKYALIIADHGYGMHGMLIDVTSDNDHMFIKEIGLALETAEIDIDLIGFDACLMQMIEVAYEIRNTGADIMVGSENPGTTWPFWDIIKVITKIPEMTEVQLGDTIVDLYYNSHYKDSTITLSTINLKNIEKLTTTFRDLNNLMLNNPADSTYHYIREKAGDVITIIDSTVLHVKNGKLWKDNAHGISIYFPKYKGGYPPPCEGNPPDMFQYYYLGKSLNFAKDALWRKFLNHYFDQMDYPPMNPKISAARDSIKTFDECNNVDLYDFCKQLYEAD
jgi:hypothetical protein